MLNKQLNIGDKINTPRGVATVKHIHNEISIKQAAMQRVRPQPAHIVVELEDGTRTTVYPRDITPVEA